MNMKRYILTLTFFSVCLISLVLAVGCKDSHKASKNGLDISSKKIVAKVDGEPVYEGDVFRRIQAVHGNIEKEKIEPNRWQMMLEAATETEIIDTLLLKAAVSEGMKVSPDALDSALAKSREMMGEANFMHMLKERDVTEKEFRTFLEQRQLIDKYKTKLFSTISIDDTAVREYYDGHKDKFKVSASSRLEVIAVHDMEKANAIYERWKKGEDFETLSKEYSESGKEKVGRRLRFTPYDVMPMEIQQKVRRGNADDILKPIEHDSRFHVIKILEKKNEGTIDFEEAQDMVRQALRMSREQKIIQEWYQSQRKTAKIEYIRQ